MDATPNVSTTRARDFGKANRAFYTVSSLTAICKTGIRPHRIEYAFMASGSPLIPYPHGGPSFRAVCPTAPSPDSRPSARHALDRLARSLDRSRRPCAQLFRSTARPFPPCARCVALPDLPARPRPSRSTTGRGQGNPPNPAPVRHGVMIAGDDSTGGKGDDSGVTIRGRVIDG